MNDQIKISVETTRSLIAFCHEHGNKSKSVNLIRACLGALESNDIGKAIKQYEAVPLGGMGCFNDWLPEDGKCFSKLPKKNAAKEFNELVDSWSRSMRELKELTGKQS